jgi:2-keto-3-deoxy-L-fuconate dehydrogenase
MGRVGTAQEMADVAAYLCSDEASFVTGAAILADGGWTAG